MTLKIFKSFLLFLTVGIVIAGFITTQSGCSIYRFKDVSIPDTISVVKVNFIENKAHYVNPQLGSKLTDKLRQKIVSQTKLKQTTGDNADWDITATITNYTFSPSGISNQRVNTNRLTVAIHIEVNDKKAQKTNKYDVSRAFDYDGGLALQQAEQNLEEEMLRDLTDDIFNRIFSNW